MTFGKMKIRIAVFGLALLMGVFSLGNISPIYAAEDAASQRETAVNENIQTQQRVVAKDITKSVTDRTFSVGTCLEGIQFDPEKEEVSLNKIIGEDGSEYRSGKAGTYTAAYLVLPKDGTGCYVVTRKITVTDTEGTAHTSDNGGDKQKTDTETEEDTESKKDPGSEEGLESGEASKENPEENSPEIPENQARLRLLKKDRETGEPLAGAVYGLYTDPECKALLMELPATGEDGKASSEYFDAGLGQVYVKEIQAPENYLVDSDVYPADLENGNDIGITVYDRQEKDSIQAATESYFAKTDAATGKALEGAVLQVSNQNGNLIGEWTSTKEPYVLYGLPEGEYTLHEKQAPYEQGYVSAEDIIFKVLGKGSVTEVEMKDEPSRIDISNTDQTSGKELSGATLQVASKDGEILEEWVTGKKPHRVEKLPVNEELILRETAAPEGYEEAEEMRFTLTDTAEVQKIEMINVRKAEAKDSQKTKGNSPGTAEKASAPRTGDALHLPVLLLLPCGASAAVFVVMAIRRRKGSGQEEE